MRIETVINSPRDLACNAGLPNLDESQNKARATTGACWKPSAPARQQSSRAWSSSGSPALRFSGPRVTALAGTLAAATGITNMSIRALTAGLLHPSCTPGQMIYDLRRLRLAGLIGRIEHTNRYVLTPTASGRSAP